MIEIESTYCSQFAAKKNVMTACLCASTSSNLQDFLFTSKRQTN
jgi:hypothetical protein